LSLLELGKLRTVPPNTVNSRRVDATITDNPLSRTAAEVLEKKKLLKTTPVRAVFK